MSAAEAGASDFVTSLLSSQRPQGLRGREIGLWHHKRGRLLKEAAKNPNCFNDSKFLESLEIPATKGTKKERQKEKQIRPVSMPVNKLFI